jgi:hypothetical protein
MQTLSNNCPVDLIPVNENKVRLIALQVCVSSSIYMLTGFWPILILLLVDFTTRSFDLQKLSLLGKNATLLIRVFSIGNKPVDQAPKRFAARVGLTLVTLTLLLNFTYPDTARILAATLVIFSFLESGFGFCAGCLVYAYWTRIAERLKAKKS